MNRPEQQSGGQVANATHRYPTAVRWGSDYADGFRYVVATSDEEALRHAQERGASVVMSHMQRRTAIGWEFAR